MATDDYSSMNVEQLHEMVNVDNLETMATQAQGWYDTAKMFQTQIDALKADAATAKKTWSGEAADRYFLEIDNTIKSMENAKDVANGNGMAWYNIKAYAENTRTDVNEQYRLWQEAKGKLDDDKKEDADGFQGSDLLDPFGAGNNVTQEDYDEKRKAFDVAARKAANDHGTKMEDEYYQHLWNPETLNDYKPPPDPGGDVPPWPDNGGGDGGTPGGRVPGGGDPSRPQPPPGHEAPPELQTPPPVGPPPVTPPPVTPPPVTPPPVGPPPFVPPPPVTPPPPVGGRPPVGRPPTPPRPPIKTPPPPVRPPTGQPPRPPIKTPPPPVRPPAGGPPGGRPPVNPTPRPPGRTVPQVIGGRGPNGMPPGKTGPIANGQRPSPTVRPMSPQVIGGRGPTGQTGVPPGMRGNPRATNLTPGKAGMDTRGVFGTRQSKLGGPAGSAAGRGGTGAGVRSAAAGRPSATGLSRGVIMGAKKPGGAAGTAPTSAGGRGKVRRKDDDRTATIASDGPLDDVFNVDKTVVPGVIRGWTPPAETEHNAGPAMFGERPGKAAKQHKKKIDDAWDDW